MHPTVAIQEALKTVAIPVAVVAAVSGYSKYRGQVHRPSGSCGICSQLCTRISRQHQADVRQRRTRTCTSRQPHTGILVWARWKLSVDGGRISQDARAGSRDRPLALLARIGETSAPSCWVDLARGVRCVGLRREIDLRLWLWPSCIDAGSTPRCEWPQQAFATMPDDVIF